MLFNEWQLAPVQSQDHSNCDDDTLDSQLGVAMHTCQEHAIADHNHD
jgi:hypothetical protein